MPDYEDVRPPGPTGEGGWLNQMGCNTCLDPATGTGSRLVDRFDAPKAKGCEQSTAGSSAKVEEPKGNGGRKPQVA